MNIFVKSTKNITQSGSGPGQARPILALSGPAWAWPGMSQSGLAGATMALPVACGWPGLSQSGLAWTRLAWPDSQSVRTHERSKPIKTGVKQLILMVDWQLIIFSHNMLRSLLAHVNCHVYGLTISCSSAGRGRLCSVMPTSAPPR